MKVALVGPPMSGKSTLFAAVTGIEPDPGRSHGGKPQPGNVKVPDERLDRLAAHYKPKKLTHAVVELLDFGGVEPGARTEHIKQMFGTMRDMADCLAVVCPAFGGATADDAVKTWNAMKSELLFADLEVIEKRIGKLKASANRPTKTQDADKKELALLEQIQAHLEEHETWEGFELDDIQDKMIRGFRFLAQKPAIAVINADEPASIDPAKLLPAAEAKHAMVVNADIEKELGSMEPADREEFLKEMGLSEPAGPRMIEAAYDALGLMSFFTVGEDECRAWTINRGDNAVAAAGRIHSDLARGFIRAQVFAYDDFVAYGDEKEVKAKGRLREEGKDYIVHDGDIINIRFSV
ncbi:MAG: DUF933 domain-containing protein [Planctomycetota bacterium]